MFTGWWLSHPSEKYESQLGLLFPIYYGKNQKCPKPPTSFMADFSHYAESDSVMSKAELGLDDHDANKHDLIR